MMLRKMFFRVWQKAFVLRFACSGSFHVYIFFFVTIGLGIKMRFVFREVVACCSRFNQSFPGSSAPTRYFLVAMAGRVVCLASHLPAPFFVGEGLSCILNLSKRTFVFCGEEMPYLLWHSIGLRERRQVRKVLHRRRPSLLPSSSSS